MHKVYLCGPIFGCTDEDCKDWRDLATKRLREQCAAVTLNPMKRDYRGVTDLAYREIVELDKRDIAQCDFVLVNYDKPSVGTSMEIIYAWERNIPVVVVCREDTAISPWLRYHSTSIQNSFAAAFDWIAKSLA